MAIALVALVLAFQLSYFLTPLIRKIALRFDFVDRPDGQRKMQIGAVSLGGGLTLLISTIIVIPLLAYWWGPDLWLLTANTKSLTALCMAAALLAIVGIVDDARGIRGGYKLFWQVVAALLVMGYDLQIPRFVIFDYEVSLGVMGGLVTIVWLLGAINSFNLIDGVDGLAGSVGVVFSLTFGCIALMGYDYLDAMICFALAGSLLGFLRFNFPPASIYLGDTGSMFIGLVLGTIALRCSMKQAATLAFAAPLAIWSIPMFDSMAAVLRRKLSGRSIYATDRGHIHHVLLTRGMSAGQAVAFIASLCTVTSIGALVSWRLEKDWIGMATVLGVIGLLVFTRIFGHVEFVLLNTSLFGFGRFLSPFNAKEQDGVRHTRLNLQGTRRWEELWGALVESAIRFHVVKMRLNLSLPRLHEEFYASWQRSGSHARELLWQTDIPLVVAGQAVGRLRVTGLQNEACASTEMMQFIDFVESLETQLALLIKHDLAKLEDSEVAEAAAETPLQDPVPY